MSTSDRDSRVTAITSPTAAAADYSVLVAGFAGALGAGVRDVIERDDELTTIEIGAAADVPAAIGQDRPDAVLLNGDVLANAVSMRQIIVSNPSVGVVVAVSHLSRERDDRLLAAGARAVIPITAEPEELCGLLRFVARGLIGPPRPRRVSAGPGLAVLTARETEVLELLAERRSAVEIAEALHVSVATVNSHRRSIYEKLDVHSRRELAAKVAELRVDDAAHQTAFEAPRRDRLAYTRIAAAPRDHDRAVVIDMCAAIGARRWLSRSR